jgi:thioredoxin reductase
MVHDVLIVGGSYAGLSAGLPLARARRSVLVVDAGQRRNRFAPASHGFLTQDGVPPDEIAAEGRAQLMDYPSVEWVAGQVEQVRRTSDGFEARLKDGAVHRSRRLILAGGVHDELPPLPGLAERWGRQVFHCPYCHGYELQQGPVGVLATSEMSAHQARMLPDWGPTTYLLDGRPLPDADTLAQLQARGVSLEPAPVVRLAGDDALQVMLQDGRTLALAGLFIATRTDPGPLPEQLGCALEHGPMGRFVRTDAMKATTVPGVFACGDLARGAGSVPLAAGDGALAGVAAHRSLMFGLEV